MTMLKCWWWWSSLRTYYFPYIIILYTQIVRAIVKCASQTTEWCNWILIPLAKTENYHNKRSQTSTRRIRTTMPWKCFSARTKRANAMASRFTVYSVYVCTMPPPLFICSFSFVSLANVNCQLVMFHSPNICSAQLKLNELVMYKCMIFPLYRERSILFNRFPSTPVCYVSTIWYIRSNFGLFDIYGFRKWLRLIEMIKSV